MRNFEDFEVIKEAQRTHPTRRVSTNGYIVKYNDELYFVHTPDDGVNIYECESWTFDIEKHFCFEDYDPDFYDYYEVEGVMQPLVLEI